MASDAIKVGSPTIAKPFARSHGALPDAARRQVGGLRGRDDTFFEVRAARHAFL